MTSAIEVEGLSKSYGNNAVLKGLSFGVERGEICALLGANGAGKTTTLECIEGLRKYDAGVIKVGGRVGVQLQSSSLPAHIKAIEAVRLFCKWGGAPVDGATLSALGVDAFRNAQYWGLSTGQKRRLHLVLALIGDPDVVFLDEPTAGLDVEGRVALHAHIRALSARGKTIVMASHDMAEVESLCHRIAILKDGVIAFMGAPDALTARAGAQCTIHITTAQGEDTLTAQDIGEALLGRLEDYKRRGVAVLDVRIERDTLERRFMDIAKEGRQ